MGARQAAFRVRWLARAALLVLVGVPRARVAAWVTLSDDDHDPGLETAWLWNAPLDTFQDDDGLGGGIVYSVDDSFCETMLPSFRDDVVHGARWFVRCEQLTSAVRRGFNSWAANHKAIHFLDGTDSDLEAEVVVRAAVHMRPGVGASATHQLRTTSGVRTTSGGNASSARAIGRTVISFNAAECWYLDASFCHRFHQMKERSGSDTVLHAGQWTMGVIWALALLAMVYRAFRLAYKIWSRMDAERQGRELQMWQDEAARLRREAGAHGAAAAAGAGAGSAAAEAPAAEGGGGGGGESQRGGAELVGDRIVVPPQPLRRLTRKQYVELFYEVAKGMPWYLRVLLWTLILFPPIFYSTVFVPCWECYDFSAALAHEVGHALGLDHPDEAASAGENMALTEEMGEGACDRVESLVEFSSDVPRDTVMLQFTQHTPQACIGQDDLDGLNALYPTCTGTVHAPRCVVSERNIGWLRLVSALAIPLILALGVSLLVSTIVERRHHSRLQRTRQKLSHAVNANKRLRAELERLVAERDGAEGRRQGGLAGMLGVSSGRAASSSRAREGGSRNGSSGSRRSRSRKPGLTAADIADLDVEQQSGQDDTSSVGVLVGDEQDVRGAQLGSWRRKGPGGNGGGLHGVAEEGGVGGSGAEAPARRRSRSGSKPATPPGRLGYTTPLRAVQDALRGERDGDANTVAVTGPTERASHV